jgi:acyl carrier protein
MESAPVKEKVIEIVCQELKKTRDEVTLESTFDEDFGADSLDIADLVMELEDEYDICIPSNADEKIKTVGDLIKYIEEQTAGR